jgi:hypothetical protein
VPQAGRNWEGAVAEGLEAADIDWINAPDVSLKSNSGSQAICDSGCKWPGTCVFRLCKNPRAEMEFYVGLPTAQE